MKKLILIISILLTQFAYSQWEITNWKSEAGIRTFCVSDNIIVLNDTDNILLISQDTGNNWQIIDVLPNNITPNVIFVKDNTIFIGGFGFLYFSADFGISWHSRTNGLASLPIVNSFININNLIFAATSDGVFSTDDYGENWVIKNNGLDSKLSIIDILAFKDNIFISTYKGIYFSSDLGESWQPKNNGLPDNLTFDKFSTTNSSIYIGTNEDTYNGGTNRMFSSVDLGETWGEINNQPFYKSYIYSFVTSSNNILLSSKDSLFVSTDNGLTWFNNTKNLPDQLQQGIEGFFAVNDSVFVISGSELYLTTNTGNTWFCKRKVNNYSNIYSLISNEKTIFIGTSPTKKKSTYLDGFFSTSDNCNTMNPNGLVNKDILALYLNKNNIYAITNKGNFLSTNSGSTWLDEGIGYPDSSEIWSMGFFNNEIIAVCGNEGIKLSKDTGKTWVDKNYGLPLKSQSVISINTKNNNWFAGLDSSLFISNDYGDTWLPCSNGLPKTDLMIWQIEINNNDLYIVTQYGIYCSKDLGITWNLISNGLPSWSNDNYKEHYNCKIHIIDKLIIATINSIDGGVFISVDNGKNWIKKNDGISNADLAVSSLTTIGDNIFIGTNSGRFGKYGDGIYYTKLSDLITDVLDKKPIKADYTIFPNPANDYIEIIQNCKNYLNIFDKIEIYNVLGEKVVETEVQNIESIKIDISRLVTGIYYIQTGNRIFKFVKI